MAKIVIEETGCKHVNNRRFVISGDPPTKHYVQVGSGTADWIAHQIINRCRDLGLNLRNL